MANADSFRINVYIASIHIITASILDVSNAFQNIKFLIHEIFCVSTPPHYLDWFERSYPNVPLNRDDVPFFLQCMNAIQGTKQAGRQWNRLLDEVVAILIYKKSTIYHAIYIKIFTDGTVYYLTVSTDYFLNNNNNEAVFPELTIFLKNTLK